MNGRASKKGKRHVSGTFPFPITGKNRFTPIKQCFTEQLTLFQDRGIEKPGQGKGGDGYFCKNVNDFNSFRCKSLDNFQKNN